MHCRLDLSSTAIGVLGIKLIAITSYLSGEVTTAFAADVIDCRDAMVIVFIRGLYLERLQEVKADARGGMMAVGLSREDVYNAISQLISSKIGIVAINSLSSVTISGDI